jgi:hypothetical protein
MQSVCCFSFTHSGVWPHSCHKCGKGFNKQISLANHVLMHQSEYVTIYRLEHRISEVVDNFLIVVYAAD